MVSTNFKLKPLRSQVIGKRILQAKKETVQERNWWHRHPYTRFLQDLQNFENIKNLEFKP